MNQEWRALVIYPRPTETETDDDTFSTLTQALPGFGVAALGDTTMRLELTVKADTLRQAADAALHAARDAHAKAFGQPGTPTQVRVLTVEDHEKEISDPPEQDLVGNREIAEMLGVTPQRASQLTVRTDFPAPLVTLKSGPVYTRTSIEVFSLGWNRKPGRRPSNPAA